MIEVKLWVYFEVPFWVPIRSGTYKLKGDEPLTILNNFWEVSICNLVDGPVDIPPLYFVDEEQVTNEELLQKFTHKDRRYFHKRKMKTTFAKKYAFEILGDTAQLGEEGSDERVAKIDRIIIEKLQQHDIVKNFIAEVNWFIDCYTATIPRLGHTDQMRRISTYDTALHVLIRFNDGKREIMHTTKMAPDARMVDPPFPLARVASMSLLDDFREVVGAASLPSFHQVQWALTTNRLREHRYQEALVTAVIVLEALGVQYLEKKQIPPSEMRRRNIEPRGLAGWVERLPVRPPKDCKNVANLVRLRNKVVHKQRVLTVKDIATITKGIRSLGVLRRFFLETIDPSIVEREERFTSLLEPVPMITQAASVGQMVPLSIRWRREKDNYEPPKEDFPDSH